MINTEELQTTALFQGKDAATFVTTDLVSPMVVILTVTNTGCVWVAVPEEWGNSPSICVMFKEQNVNEQ